MTNNDTSLQPPNVLSQAQNSADKAERAVMQAHSHPTDQTVAEAQRSLDTAQQALHNAERGPVQLMQVQEVRDELTELAQELDGVEAHEERHH